MKKLFKRYPFLFDSIVIGVSMAVIIGLTIFAVIKDQHIEKPIIDDTETAPVTTVETYERPSVVIPQIVEPPETESESVTEETTAEETTTAPVTEPITEAETTAKAVPETTVPETAAPKLVEITSAPETTAEVTTAAETKSGYLGRFKLTAYCACSKCCGKWGAQTATGTVPTQGRTIAVDPKVIPYGSSVYIEGWGTYIAEDCGGGIKNNRIDIFFNSHAEALNFGVRYADVYLEP